MSEPTPQHQQQAEAMAVSWLRHLQVSATTYNSLVMQVKRDLPQILADQAERNILLEAITLIFGDRHIHGMTWTETARSLINECERLRKDVQIRDDLYKEAFGAWAAAKGEEGRKLGTALEEAVKENAELRAERDELKLQCEAFTRVKEGQSKLYQALRAREAALMKQLEDAKLPTVEHIQDIYELTKLRAQNVALLAVAKAANSWLNGPILTQAADRQLREETQLALCALKAAGVEL